MQFQLTSYQKHQQLNKPSSNTFALKVAEIKRRNQEKKINNRFAYLRKLMQKDMEANAEEETAQQLAVACGTQAF